MPPVDLYELGSMDDDEIVGAANEETISSKVKEMVRINDDLYKALASYKLAVSLGRWTSPLGALLYATDDIERATYEVENWHTGALKWMTDGAQAVRDGKVAPEAWGEWGIRLSESAREVGAKLNDSGIVSRAKSFASTMPESFKKAAQIFAKGAGTIAKPFLAEIPWWIWVVGGGIGLVVVLNAIGGVTREVSGAARAVRGD